MTDTKTAGRAALIAALQAEIRKQRARIDPKLLKMAEDALYGRTPAPAADTDAGALSPAEQQAAIAAVTLFLKNHNDAKAFQEKLAQLIHKNSH